MGSTGVVSEKWFDRVQEINIREGGHLETYGIIL